MENRLCRWNLVCYLPGLLHEGIARCSGCFKTTGTIKTLLVRKGEDKDVSCPQECITKVILPPRHHVCYCYGMSYWLHATFLVHISYTPSFPVLAVPHPLHLRTRITPLLPALKLTNPLSSRGMRIALSCQIFPFRAFSIVQMFCPSPSLFLKPLFLTTVTLSFNPSHHFRLIHLPCVLATFLAPYCWYTYLVGSAGDAVPLDWPTALLLALEGQEPAPGPETQHSQQGRWSCPY